MQITRRLEFDAGHRIPNHNSQCRHLHGHRYAIEITLSGEVVTTAENLARVAFDLLDGAYQDTYGNHLRLERVRLYETPNNWADHTR